LDKIVYNGIKSLRVVGGVQIDFQALEIQKGCDILIGTPGRIK
jgi:superfamily II DNA/RNA helicase